MAAPSLLLDFALILITAELGAVVFRFLRLPPVLGMLVAGILLGPFTPGYVVNPEDLADLALLGAVFLMFSSGLTFDIRGFRAYGGWPFVLAGLGVIFSFLVGLLAGVLLGWSLLASLFLGLILTSTSTLLALQFLADLGLGDEPGARLVVAAILVDDIAALLLMTLVVGVASPAPVAAASLIVGLGVVIGLAAFLVFAARRMVPRVLRVTNRFSPSSTVMFAISFALLVSFAFAALGLPPLVGAFFAGSIVASTEFGPRVSRHITPVTAVFTGVFFASIGLLIDPARLPAVLVPGAVLVLLAVLSKIGPALLVLRRATRLPRDRSWRLASVMVPRAEIALIIAQYGVAVGSPPELLGLAMLVMAGTALVTPALAKARVTNRRGVLQESH